MAGYHMAGHDPAPAAAPPATGAIGALGVAARGRRVGPRRGRSGWQRRSCAGRLQAEEVEWRGRRGGGQGWRDGDSAPSVRDPARDPNGPLSTSLAVRRNGVHGARVTAGRGGAGVEQGRRHATSGFLLR